MDRALYQDLKTYLPEDILALSDRLGMHHSLEIRVPFIDHKVVEYCARIPSHMKIKGMSISQIFLLVMEHGFFRYPRRYWIAGAGEPFTSMTTKLSALNKKIETPKEKNFDPKKAHKLAEFMDNKTYYSHHD